jgi:hypothetical protein
VPVPTGEDPAKEGAEVTKASEAALGDPTKAGSAAGEADDARPTDPAVSGGRRGEEVAE